MYKRELGLNRSDVLVQNGRKIDYFSELLRKTPLRFAQLRPSERDGPLTLCRGIDKGKTLPTLGLLCSGRRCAIRGS